MTVSTRLALFLPIKISYFAHTDNYSVGVTLAATPGERRRVVRPGARGYVRTA